VRMPPTASAAHQKPLGIGFVFEAEDSIISKAHDDHGPVGVALPPLLRPEIEHIVQIDTKGNFDRLGRRIPRFWANLKESECCDEW
jgi:hypothetical protein